MTSAAGSITSYFNYCFACGRGYHDQPDWWPVPYMLEVAHIIGGGGRAKWQNDRRAVVVLCSICHKAQHDRVAVFPHGKRFILPQLSKSNLVALKRLIDPKFFDSNYLDSIATGRAPDGEYPVSYYVDQLIARRPYVLRRDPEIANFAS